MGQSGAGGSSAALRRFSTRLVTRFDGRGRRSACAASSCRVSGKSIEPLVARVAPGELEQVHHFVATSRWSTEPIEAVLLEKADALVGGDDAQGNTSAPAPVGLTWQVPERSGAIPAPSEAPPSVAPMLPRPCTPRRNQRERGGAPRHSTIEQIQATTCQVRVPQRVYATRLKRFDSRRLHSVQKTALPPREGGQGRFASRSAGHLSFLYCAGPSYRNDRFPGRGGAVARSWRTEGACGAAIGASRDATRTCDGGSTGRCGGAPLRRACQSGHSVSFLLKTPPSALERTLFAE